MNPMIMLYSLMVMTGATPTVPAHAVKSDSGQCKEIIVTGKIRMFSDSTQKFPQKGGEGKSVGVPNVWVSDSENVNGRKSRDSAITGPDGSYTLKVKHLRDDTPEVIIIQTMPWAKQWRKGGSDHGWTQLFAEKMEDCVQNGYTYITDFYSKSEIESYKK